MVERERKLDAAEWTRQLCIHLHALAKVCLVARRVLARSPRESPQRKRSSGDPSLAQLSPKRIKWPISAFEVT